MPMFTATVEPTATVVRVCFVEKPDSSAVTSYAPGTRPANTYSPWALVTVERVLARSTDFRVTFTPGRTAPDWSVTVPVILPDSWAAAKAGIRNTIASAASQRTLNRI